MTNEQTAVMLGGYLKELNEAISTAKDQIKPTLVESLGSSLSLSVEKEYQETWPELDSVIDMANRLSCDIDTLNGIQTITGSY